MDDQILEMPPCGGCIDLSVEIADGWSLFLGTAFPIAGVVFAAGCTWLAVRIFNRRERWAKRTAGALAAVLIGYLLTFGPAVWLTARGHIDHRILATTYWPVLWGCASAPDPIRAIGFGFGSAGIPDDGALTICICRPGGELAYVTFGGRQISPMAMAP